MNLSESVKQVLLEKIQEMAAQPEAFVRNPGRDFTRTRKLDFETIIRCLIAMESGSLKKELLELFITILTPQRSRPLTSNVKRYCPEALKFLFPEFNNSFAQYQLYRGYRLLACDGTALNIARNPSDQENYFQSNPGEKGFNPTPSKRPVRSMQQTIRGCRNPTGKKKQ